MFFEILDRLCKNKGISISTLGSIIGFSSGTSSGWKRGVDPSPKYLKKIAAYFEVSVDYLLTGSEVKSDPTFTEYEIGKLAGKLEESEKQNGELKDTVKFQRDQMEKQIRIIENLTQKDGKEQNCSK